MTADTISRLSEPPHESRVGVNRPLPGLDLSSGQWWTNTDGSKVWSLEIRSMGATGLRLHIRNFDVGTGRLWVFDPSQAGSALSYTAKGPLGTGEFWTNTIFAETVQMDFMPGSGPSAQFSLLVPELYHWWAPHPFPNPSGRLIPVTKSAASPVLGPPGGDISCFKDASCYFSTANPYVKAISLADVYLVFADQTCSGTLLIDRNATDTPYVLTAGHCVSGEDLTQLESFFQFRTPSCTTQDGAFGDLSSIPFPIGSAYPSVAGASLLVSSLKEDPPGSGVIDMSVPDFGFLRLANNPPGVVYYAGWTTASQTGETVSSITHPRNLPQAFTQGTVTGTLGSSFLNFFPNLGLLDHGSSGGGQFNNASQLIAVESSMQSAADPSVYGCTLPVYGDYFTSFSAIYPLVEPWLEDTIQPVTFTASPNSVPPGASVVTLTWNAPGSSMVAVRVGSPTGTLFASGFTSGSAITGDWATPGMTFYLIDLNTGSILEDLTLQAAGNTGSPTISASPNPLPSGTNVVTVSWNAAAYASTFIRVGSPTGTLFAAGGASGTATTGPWALPGMTFYLVDQNSGAGLASVTLQSAATGSASISASPDPLPAGTNEVTLTWNAPGYSSTLIRVGSANGTLFASGGASGTAMTGPWASPGMTFYLIDQTSGATLAQVTL